MSAGIGLDNRSRRKLEVRARQIRRLLEKSRALNAWPAVLRYFVTALLVATSLAVCLALEGVSSYPLFVFLPPIILASFLFGRNAGYFATLLSAIVAPGLLLGLEAPLLPVDASKIMAVVAFALVGLVTSYAIDAVRITIDVLAENALLREEKRGLEKELFHAQKLEAMGRANSILAHDFKNVLAPVMSGIYLLRIKLPPDDELSDLLDMLDNACCHGARLAEDIQSFGGKERAACVAVNLNAAVEAYLPVVRQSVQATVSLELRLEEGLPDAWLDPALLHRALANLIDNAADAMPGGGTIRITTSMQRLDAMDFCGFGRCTPGDYLCLAVTDTGTGMLPDVQARLFEPFFTTKPAGQGTGLGMPMVADFARHAQGCVAVDSRPGAGTTIRLFLPLAPSAAASPGRGGRERPRGQAIASGA